MALSSSQAMFRWSVASASLNSIRWVVSVCRLRPLGKTQFVGDNILYFESERFCGSFASRRYSFERENDTSPCLDILQQLLISVEQRRTLKSKSSTLAASLRGLALQFCHQYKQLPSIHSFPPYFSQRRGSSRQDILQVIVERGSESLNERVPTAVLECAARFPAKNESSNINTERDLRSWQTALQKLRQACVPLYEDVIKCLLETSTIEGMHLIVSMREDLLQLIPMLQNQQQTQDVDRNQTGLLLSLKLLDDYLRDILESWFAPGLLEVKRLTYHSSPASIIETIAKHEAVHPVQNLDDLRNRLGPDRRVFALFHPILPERPLVVLHVSLQPDIPESMQQVYQRSHEEDARVATFYSISNIEPGLAGVGLGEYLIKRSTELLQNELPTITTFVTLSPLPRFRKWLEERAAASGKFAPTDLIPPKQLCSLSSALACSEAEVLQKFVERLACSKLDELSEENKKMFENLLENLGARYIVKEKHRSKPLDGVARFHVGNGAIVYRINCWADLSRKGWQSSFGLMVNYLYTLDVLSANQAHYESDFQIPVSDLVDTILQTDL